jgi:hypothetical protein
VIPGEKGWPMAKEIDVVSLGELITALVDFTS